MRLRRGIVECVVLSCSLGLRSNFRIDHFENLRCSSLNKVTPQINTFVINNNHDVDNYYLK